MQQVYKNSYEIDCVAGDLKVEVKAGKPHRRYLKDTIVLDEEEIPGFLIELFCSVKSNGVGVRESDKIFPDHS